MVEYIKHAPHTVGKDPIWIHLKPHLWWSYHYFVLGKILFASWLNSLVAGFLQNYIPSWWFNHPTIFSSKKCIPNYPKFIFHTLAQQNSIPKHPIFSLRGNPVENPPRSLSSLMAQESYPKNQQRGAVLLALVAFGLAVDRFYAFYELQSCKGARHCFFVGRTATFCWDMNHMRFFLSNIFMDLRTLNCT